MSRTFHFTIGPVQGFVAQARRTRDFWAGSFILSWLAAVAMKAAEKQGGEILFPKPDKDFMEALEGLAGADGAKPQQGTVPNRFMVSLDKAPEFKPEQVEKAVRSAWSALAEQVWRGDGLEEIGGETARAIWNRQVAGFWEISWAVTEERDASVLDRRKNWRSHRAPEEPGNKCHMMDAWQELSGAERPGQEGKGFWNALRGSDAKGIQTDLREDEALCPPAYIKRRLTRHFRKLQKEMPDGWTLHGWDLPSGVPSVAYMAGAHWLADTIRNADTDRIRAFDKAAHDLTGSYGEWESNVSCVRDAVRAVGGEHKWQSLDGDVLFEEFLDNSNSFTDQDQAAEVRKELGRLKESAGTGHPTPFYAMLLMDGDNLGQFMADEDNQNPITEGLKDFTGAVPDIVKHHNGFPIYAGGDDVLALLPLEDALPCAAALREKYRGAFAEARIPTSLSGAVIYAHVRTPLTRVIGEAHPLLDDVAKEATGRDALAVQVRKPSGVTAQWAMPWQAALDEGQVALQNLADQLGKVEGKAPFANRFFYALRERFDLLNPRDEDRAAADALFEDPEGAGRPLAEDLVAAEYLGAARAAGNKAVDLPGARQMVGPLLAQCQPKIRRTDERGEREECEPQMRLKADGALIVRFLAQKGAQG